MHAYATTHASAHVGVHRYGGKLARAKLRMGDASLLCDNAGMAVNLPYGRSLAEEGISSRRKIASAEARVNRHQSQITAATINVSENIADPPTPSAMVLVRRQYTLGAFFEYISVNKSWFFFLNIIHNFSENKD